MQNKYPEIWLRELVMLNDLQTSSIFSLSPSFLLCPLSLLDQCQPTKGPRHKGEKQAWDTQPNYYWSVCTQDCSALTCTHACTNTHTNGSIGFKSPLRSGSGVLFTDLTISLKCHMNQFTIDTKYVFLIHNFGFMYLRILGTTWIFSFLAREQTKKNSYSFQCEYA